jgi:hypothetical protein
VCAFAAVTAVASASLLAAAALVPAPPVILAVVIVISIGFPMLASYELARALPALRRSSRVRAELRRQLDELPETQHPLGL